MDTASPFSILVLTVSSTVFVFLFFSIISTAFSGFFSTTLTIISVIFFLLSSLLFALLTILSPIDPLLFSTISVTNSKSSSDDAFSTAFSIKLFIL